MIQEETYSWPQTLQDYFAHCQNDRCLVSCWTYLCQFQSHLLQLLNYLLQFHLRLPAQTSLIYPFLQKARKASNKISIETFGKSYQSNLKKQKKQGENQSVTKVQKVKIRVAKSNLVTLWAFFIGLSINQPIWSY